MNASSQTFAIISALTHTDRISARAMKAINWLLTVVLAKVNFLKIYTLTCEANLITVLVN